MQERHTLDALSLVFGLLFAALAIPVLVTNTPLDFDGRWIIPIAAIVIGLAIAVSALRKNPDQSALEDLPTDPAVATALEELPETPDF